MVEEAEFLAVGHFEQELDVLLRGNFPLIVIKTGEILSLVNNIRFLAAKNNFKQFRWDSGSGIKIDTYTQNPETGKSKTDPRPISQEGQHKDFLSGLKYFDISIGEIKARHELAVPFITTFVWPHNEFRKSLDIAHLLYKMSYVLPQNMSKFLFVVPDTFEIPIELENIMTTLEYPKPSIGDIVKFIGKNNKESSLYETVRYTILTDKTSTANAKVIKMIEVLPNYTEPAQILETAKALCGLTYFEITATVARVFARNDKYLPNLPFDKFVAEVAEIKAKTLAENRVLEIMTPGSMDDIGGLDLLKEWASMRKKCFTPEAIKFGVKRPRGVLLIGPSGCGKSLAAKALSRELGMPLVRFDVSRVFDSKVGGSEANVSRALEDIRNQSPCCVFVDEIDKIFSLRTGETDGGTSTRVLSSLLTFMQECEQTVFWILTANRITNLPPELIRAGRIDDKFILVHPNKFEVPQIINIHLMKRKQSPISLADTPELQAVIDHVVDAHFSAAEIEVVVNECVIESFNKNKPITAEMLLNAFKRVNPVADVNKEDYLKINEHGLSNARLASSQPTQDKLPDAREMPDGPGGL